jgi:hypothetical protein
MALPRIGFAAQPADEQGTSLPAGVKLLNANDRCDAAECTSQARAVILLSNGSELMFCRHHTEAYRANLEEKGASIYTQYEGL